jgi:hypothetical protein
MTLNLRRLALAGAALPLLMATASFAQPAPPPDAHGAAGPGEVRREVRVMRMGGHRNPAAHAQHLRDALQLRPDQEAALQAFIDASKPPEGGPGHMMDKPGEGQTLTTPQRMDRMLAHMDQARAHMARHADAVKRFYAALSPSQQKAFDAMHGHGMGGPNMRFMHRMGPGGHGGAGGGHMGHPPMPGGEDMGEPED